jgi:hypothetical protein
MCSAFECGTRGRDAAGGGWGVLMESPFDQERRWLAELERLGPKIVRARQRAGKPVTDQAPYPDASFVQAWLRRKDRETRRRIALYCTLLVLIAAVTVISAWRAIKPWLGL